jgi:holo-ACP synthase
MNSYFKGEEQSLEDILKARETRVQYQEYLLDKYRNTIVAFKLNIPGPVKYNPLIRDIFDEGLKVLKQSLDEASIEVVQQEAVYKNSGPEAFIVLNLLPNIIKKLTALIEENHPLGRLYDFDVINLEGLQLSREEIGMQPRKCLLCEKNAFECGRSRSHEVGALIAKIEKMALDYFNVRQSDRYTL